MRSGGVGMSNSNKISAEARAKRIADKIAQRNKTKELVAFLDSSLASNESYGWSLNDIPSQNLYMAEDKLFVTKAIGKTAIDIMILGQNYQKLVAAVNSTNNMMMAYVTDEKEVTPPKSMLVSGRKFSFKGLSYNLEHLRKSHTKA